MDSAKHNKDEVAASVETLGETSGAGQCALTVAQVLRGMPGGFLVLDGQLRVHVANRQVEKLLGPAVEGEEEFGRMWPAHAGSGLVKTMRLALEQEGDLCFEEGLFGGRVWLEIHARRDGGLLHLHLEDMTFRKHSDAELAGYAAHLLKAKAAFERQAVELATTNHALVDARRAADSARALAEKAAAQAEAAAETAEAASSAKSSFLANMSHEIRTPMTAIVGYAEMMLEPGQTNDQRRDCLQTIRRNARHLLDLINDILDISKIEAGKMTVERIEVELPRLVAEVVSMMRPRCLEKGLDFQLVFEGPVRRRLETDPLRLRQILVNLLGNAVKFTRQGMVMLKVKCDGEAKGAQAGRVRFEVSDTGIGIPDASLGKLFQPFEQQDTSTTREYGGTGLGLTISKRLATMLGGDISVESRVGEGSTFGLEIDGGVNVSGVWSTISEAEIPTLMAKPAVPKSLGTVDILLVEDGVDNQRLLSMYLKAAGARVTVAENGLAALELVEVRAASGGYDLILMDMQMPVMDGYSATSELRRRGVTVPVVALTAHAMSHDRQKCIAAGCTDYVTKPIELDVLMTTLAMHLPGRVLCGTATTPEAAAVTIAVGVPPAVYTGVDLGADSGADSGAESGPGGAVVSVFRDDPDMEELVVSFVEGLSGMVGELLASHAAGRTAEVTRTLHQLKGSGGGFGFHEITVLAGRAEAAFKAAASDRIEALDALVALCRRVEGYERSREVSATIDLRASA